METSTPRLLLSSICADSPWAYAVFWKFKHQNETLLTWEDGYCDYIKSQGFLEKNSDHGEGAESISGGPQSSRSPSVFAFGFAIGYMSSLQYALGEGVIGKVALHGNVSWIFPGDTGSGISCCSKPKFPDEWHLQISAGIKTVLLIPVLPYGVLQLGSIDKVAENQLIVTEIRERFDSFQPGRNPTAASCDRFHSSTSIKANFEVDQNEGLSFWNQLWERSQSETLEVIAPSKLTQQEHSESDSLAFMVGDMLPVFERNLVDPSLDPLEVLNQQSLYTCNYPQETLRSNLFALACMGEVIQHSLQYDGGNKEHQAEAVGQIDGSYTSGDTLEDPITEDNVVFSDHPVTGVSLGFPVGYELHRTLDPAFQIENDEIPWESYELYDYDSIRPSYLGSDSDFMSSYDPSTLEIHGYVEFEDNVGQVLQPVMAGLFEKLIDSETDDLYGSKPTIAIMQIGSSSTIRPQCELKSTWSGEETTPSNLETASFLTEVETSHESTDSDPTNASVVTTLVEETKPRKRSCGNSGKCEKQLSDKKRKVRENSGHKQRPRDRQLIQDRLKELRDLIPNGSTCSIDSLLDKAIKHLMFLSNVTQQAEKLSQTVDIELYFTVSVERCLEYVRASAERMNHQRKRKKSLVHNRGHYIHMGQACI